MEAFIEAILTNIQNFPNQGAEKERKGIHLLEGLCPFLDILSFFFSFFVSSMVLVRVLKGNYRWPYYFFIFTLQIDKALDSLNELFQGVDGSSSTVFQTSLMPCFGGRYLNIRCEQYPLSNIYYSISLMILWKFI